MPNQRAADARAICVWVDAPLADALASVPYGTLSSHVRMSLARAVRKGLRGQSPVKGAAYRLQCYLSGHLYSEAVLHCERHGLELSALVRWSLLKP